MKGYLKNIVKAGALFAAVGAALALATPLLASGLAAIGAISAVTAANVTATTSIGWLAGFFGTFGALDAGLRPVANRVFDGKVEPAPELPAQQANAEPAQVPEKASNRFRDLVKAAHGCGCEKGRGA